MMENKRKGALWREAGFDLSRFVPELSRTIEISCKVYP